VHKLNLAAALGAILATGAWGTVASADDADYTSGAASGPVVQTAEGPVQGFVNPAGVHEFLGIPYAAPPVGKLRWMPPQPVEKWSKALEATKFGQTCAQITTLGVFAGPASVSEDCLYLNVFTNAVPGSSGGKGMPVLVWIHGGGNVDGESNDYDATKLATGGPKGVPTVVVTLNYRLNLFGFLAHPALDAEGHPADNYGILDQQAVLHWVQRNIAKFGGDPSRVALGGQSAGAQDTGANQISPLAAGLFSRAIYESSPLAGLAAKSVGTAHGKAMAVAAGCGIDASSATAACLRNLTAAQILQLSGTPNVQGPYITGPMVDGTVIPVTPVTAWTTGAFNKMPIMAGNVQDEQNFTISINEYFANPQAPYTADQYEAAINTVYGGAEYSGGPLYPAGTAQKVLTEYPPNFNGHSPQAVYDLAGTHPGACRNVLIDALWTKYVPVYEYEFNYQNAPYYFPNMPGYDHGAAHTIDIQFLFQNWHGSVLGVNHPSALNQQEQLLSDELVAAWTNFASTGNPNGSGNSPWPVFTTATNQPAVFSEDSPLSTFTLAGWSNRHHCDFWTNNTLNGGILRFQP
jgi:para-nitrobenzyl esterase